MTNYCPSGNEPELDPKFYVDKQIGNKFTTDPPFCDAGKALLNEYPTAHCKPNFCPKNGEFKYAGKNWDQCWTGCFGRLCTLGHNALCERTSYNANPLQCCLNNQVPNSNKMVGNLTCDPKYRDISSKDCQSELVNYCSNPGTIDSLICRNFCDGDREGCDKITRQYCQNTRLNEPICKNLCLGHPEACRNNIVNFCRSLDPYKDRNPQSNDAPYDQVCGCLYDSSKYPNFYREMFVKGAPNPDDALKRLRDLEKEYVLPYDIKCLTKQCKINDTSRQFLAPNVCPSISCNQSIDIYLRDGSRADKIKAVNRCNLQIRRENSTNSTISLISQLANDLESVQTYTDLNFNSLRN